MRKRFDLVNILIFLLFLIIFSRCQPKTPIIFSEQCSAPCWRNLEPGKTNSAEALKAIKGYSDIKLDNISISGPWNIFSNFIDFNLVTDEKVQVYMIDDVVSLIMVSNLKGINFRNCIAKLGDPKYAAISSSLGPGLPIIPASDANHIWFSAIYPSTGIVLSHDTYNVWLGENLKLAKTTFISQASIYDPKKFTLLLQKGFLIPSDSNGNSQNNLVAWKGYGDINLLYPEFLNP